MPTTLNKRILDLALAGHTPSDISEYMNVSPKVVKTALQDLTSPTPITLDQRIHDLALASHAPDTIAFDFLDVPHGQVLSSLQDLTKGPSHVALTLGNGFADAVESDAPVLVHATDAGGKFVPVITATPPAWLDAAGNILVPGLYSIGCFIAAVTVGLPGFYAITGSSFNVDTNIPLDPIGALNPNGHNTLDNNTMGSFDVAALSAANLPRQPGWGVTIDPAATGWVVRVRTFVSRLLY